MDDLDAFPVEPARDPQVEAAIAAERAAMRQQPILGHEASIEAKDVTPSRTHLRALVYASRSGGGPHVVTLHDLPAPNGGYEQGVLCICEATRNLARRPQGCWAMVDGREVFGLAPIGGG